MRRILASAAAMMLGLGAAPLPAAEAQMPVSIELVLAVDTSLSVDETEFALQMAGMAAAFRTPEIIALIEQHEGVAVTLFQWSGTIDPDYAIPWHLLTGPATAHAFADKIERLRREPSHGFTAMGQAIRTAIEALERNAVAGRERKIDISADGRSNIGPLPSDSWPRAEALGITINGLPILIDTYNLDAYFRNKVVAGPGAFIEIADDYRDFANAFLRKLRRELAPAVSRAISRPPRTRLATRE